MKRQSLLYKNAMRNSSLYVRTVFAVTYKPSGPGVSIFIYIIKIIFILILFIYIFYFVGHISNKL